MQTSGNILFTEFKKAYYYPDELGEYADIHDPLRPGIVRCCLLDDEVARFENGQHELCANKCKVDPDAIINGTTLQRPYCWYQINSNDSHFAPKNCDQLPLHIIRFMLMKLMDAETKVKHGGLLGWIYDFLRDMIDRIRGIFGTMNTDELKQIIGKMQRSGIIKDTGDGIEILKRF